MKPRRRLDYYDDEEDEEELLEWVRHYSSTDVKG